MTFTASNGVEITISDERDHVTMTIEDGVSALWCDPSDIDALREFFQHEEDERLGRWRYSDPISQSDFLVYQRGDVDGAVIRVVSERDGSQVSFAATPGVLALESGHRRAARAYFATHEPPKPWLDAKPGEVWLVEIESSGPYPCIVTTDEDFDSGLFRLPLASKDITAAERIYPRGES